MRTRFNHHIGSSLWQSSDLRDMRDPMDCLGQLAAFKVLSMLDSRTLLICGAVSKSWRALTMDACLWERHVQVGICLNPGDDKQADTYRKLSV